METEIRIKNNYNEDLVGIYHQVNDDKKVVIVCHGHTGTKERNFIPALCSELNKNGYNAFRFDFSGNGESDGKFEESTHSKEVEDLKSVIDYFSGKGFEQIALIGHSMGGVVCILETSTDKRIKLLVSIAGSAYPERFRQRFIKKKRITEGELEEELNEKEFIDWYKEKAGKRFNFKMSKTFFEDIKKHKPIEAVKNIKCPVLLIHGDKDETIDVSESKEIYQKANQPKDLIIIKNGDHTFDDIGIRDEMIKKLINWLKSKF